MSRRSSPSTEVRRDLASALPRKIHPAVCPGSRTNHRNDFTDHLSAARKLLEEPMHPKARPLAAERI